MGAQAWSRGHLSSAQLRPGSSAKSEQRRSGHNRAPCPQPHHTGHSPSEPSPLPRIILLGPGAGQQARPSSDREHPRLGPSPIGVARHCHRGGGLTCVAPFFGHGLRPIPPASTLCSPPTIPSWPQGSAAIAGISAQQVDFIASDVAHERQRVFPRLPPNGPGHPGARRPGARLRFHLTSRRGPGWPDQPPSPTAHLPRKITVLWNNPAITALNAGITLLLPCRRSTSQALLDGSCTTPLAPAQLPVQRLPRPGQPRSGPTRTPNWLLGKEPKATAV